MSKYVIGVDMAYGDDQTMYCIQKYPGFFMRLINKILRRGYSVKVIYVGSDIKQLDKRRFRRARILGEL